jgi:uncharacterized membrane protein YphA (DoxX/SURF4 family)
VNPLRAIDSRFLAPVPADRLATLRLLSGAFSVIYLIVRAPVLADFRFVPGRFEPVGAAAWLSAPISPWLAFALYSLAVGSGVAFTLGWRFRVAGPVFALLMLWVTSYRNSWGMVFHTDNLLVLHLLVLAQSDAAAVLSLDARTRAEPPAAARFGWPVRLISACTVLAYLLAGIAKLKVTGVSWMDGEVLRNYVAYDGLRKSQIGSIHSPFGAILVQYEWPFPALSVLTMLLELTGPVLLLWPRASRIWAYGLYGFHIGVFASMAIAFPYPLSGIAFASLFECERLWRLRWFGWLPRLLRGRARLQPSPAGVE